MGVEPRISMLLWKSWHSVARSSSSIDEMSVISGKAAQESSRLNRDGIRLERQRSNFLVLDAGTVARLVECRKLYPRSGTC